MKRQLDVLQLEKDIIKLAKLIVLNRNRDNLTSVAKD